MKRLILIAVIAAAAAASAANVCYEGRWLDSEGNVRRNATVPAVLAAYAGEADSTPLDSKPVTIATDGDGRFAATVKDLAVSQSLQSFWIGVTPEGGSEIKPRMRVNPAPFALVAATAKRVETQTATFTGTTQADSLTGGGSGNPGEVEAQNVMLTGAATLKGDVTGAGTLYLENVDLSRGGGLDMMNTESKDNISIIWDDFVADEEIETMGSNLLPIPQVSEIEIAAESDAIAMVMIQAVRQSALDMLSATLSNGDFNVLDQAFFDNTGDDAYLFTFPVRRGNVLFLRLESLSVLFEAPVMRAKVKMVYFGRND